MEVKFKENIYAKKMTKHRKSERGKGQRHMKEETKTEKVFSLFKYFHYFKTHFTFKLA